MGCRTSVVLVAVLAGCVGSASSRKDQEPTDEVDGGDTDELADTDELTDTDETTDTDDTPTAELIFTGDFELTGNFTPGVDYPQFSSNIDSCEYDEMCDTDSLEIVTSPVRSGTRAVRMILKATDVQETSGTRVELQSRGFYETTLEEDYWYGWSIYVPSDWVVDADDMKVVHQWHTASDQPGGSPIIGLRIKGSEWRITRELTESNSTTLWSGAVQTGVWTDWVMHIRWSPTTTGVFAAWKDGEQVYSETGQNMHAGTSAGGHYQKLGMYGVFDGDVQERLLYYDEVRVAKGADGYDLVAP